MMIGGTCVEPGILLMRRAASIPSMPGIFQSMSTRS